MHYRGSEKKKNYFFQPGVSATFCHFISCDSYRCMHQKYQAFLTRLR